MIEICKKKNTHGTSLEQPGEKNHEVQDSVWFVDPAPLHPDENDPFWSSPDCRHCAIPGRELPLPKLVPECFQKAFTHWLCLYDGQQQTVEALQELHRFMLLHPDAEVTAAPYAHTNRMAVKIVCHQPPGELDLDFSANGIPLCLLKEKPQNLLTERPFQIPSQHMLRPEPRLEPCTICGEHRKDTLYVLTGKGGKAIAKCAACHKYVVADNVDAAVSLWNRRQQFEIDAAALWKRIQGGM